jgi:hypothetical protein
MTMRRKCRQVHRANKKKDNEEEETELLDTFLEELDMLFQSQYDHVLRLIGIQRYLFGQVSQELMSLEKNSDNEEDAGGMAATIRISPDSCGIGLGFDSNCWVVVFLLLPLPPSAMPPSSSQRGRRFHSTSGRN